MLNYLKSQNFIVSILKNSQQILLIRCIVCYLLIWKPLRKPKKIKIKNNNEKS